MATVTRFSFDAHGQTLTEVADKLDELTNDALLREGGEPWLVTIDRIEKIAINANIVDPKAWIYQGRREVVFTGPTPMDTVQWRDGWKPQSETDIS